MSILNKLQSNGSSLSKLNGKTPNVKNFAESKVHDTYSINGDPSLTNLPSPSRLASGFLPKYTDNLPR